MNGVLCAGNKEETNYVIIQLLLVCHSQIKCQIKVSVFNGVQATCSGPAAARRNPPAPDVCAAFNKRSPDAREERRSKAAPVGPESTEEPEERHNKPHLKEKG